MVKNTQNTYNLAVIATCIVIIAHIRNSTPKEFAVIAKYTTNYETISASWNSERATSAVEVVEKLDRILQGTPIDVAMKKW